MNNLELEKILSKKDYIILQSYLNQLDLTVYRDSIYLNKGFLRRSKSFNKILHFDFHSNNKNTILAKIYGYPKTTHEIISVLREFTDLDIVVEFTADYPFDSKSYCYY